MPNGRCRMHGGNSPGGSGALPGNGNAVTHGLYARFLGPELAAEADELRQQPSEDVCDQMAAGLSIRVMRSLADPGVPLAAITAAFRDVARYHEGRKAGAAGPSADFLDGHAAVDEPAGDDDGHSA